jgi:hypothetical protein
VKEHRFAVDVVDGEGKRFVKAQSRKVAGFQRLWLRRNSR